VDARAAADASSAVDTKPAEAKGADPARTTPTTSEPPSSENPLHGLTARDLVLALRVVANGADASEVLGENVRWEALFSALLSLMLKKHLIADWEFVDELKKQL
jgi:heme-binding NEAT domain protein